MEKEKSKWRMNKKGYSFSGWTEVILILVLLTSLIGMYVAEDNNLYGKNYDASWGLGLQNDANTTLNSFKTYQTSYETAVNTGTASYTSVFGLVLSSSYDLVVASVRTLWTVLSGRWILNAVTLMQWPIEVGVVLQIIFVLSIGFILLQILFRTLYKP